MQVDDITRNRQTQTSPLAHRPGGIKRIEYPGPVLFTDSGTTIRHFQPQHPLTHVETIFMIAVQLGLTGQCLEQTGNDQFTLPFHGMGRIHEQVDQHLLQFIGIQIDVRKVPGKIRFYRDITLPHLVANQMQGTFHDLIHISRLE